MKKLIGTLVFISMILIPQYVFGEKVDVTFHWQHSGRGMDIFAFSPAPTSVGPWMGSYSIKITDLTPSVVDGKNTWKGTISIDVEDLNNLSWWVCYAESSGGKQSELSNPAKSIFPPAAPTDLTQIHVRDKTQVVVLFI